MLVSPGSTEICDGRDNDCDGYADILDANVQWAGWARRVNREHLRRVDIAWHDDEFFFVADEIGEYGYSSIFSGYERMDGSGPTLYGETLDGVQSALFDSPRITSLNGTLGLVAHRDGMATRAQFAILDDQGTAVIRGDGWGRPGDITHDGSSFIMATTNADFAFYFASGSTTGTVSDPVERDSMPGTVHYQNAARSGSVTGVVYTDYSGPEPSVQLMRLSSGVMLGPTELAQPAQMGDIATLSNGDFAVAWATPAGFKLQVRTTTGTTVVCDAPETTFGNGTLDELDSVAVADSSLGILVFAADAGGTTGEAAVFVFDHDCTLLTEQGKQMFDRSLLTHERELPHLPRIAVGGNYVAFAWTVQESDAPEDHNSYVRVVPEAMCE